MGVLRFRIAEKISIVFGNSFIDFLRGGISTKPLDVTYSNGTGQIISSNQVVYTYLNPLDIGYIEVKSLANQILNGSGVLNLSMTHRVSSTQINQNVNFSIYSSPINIQVSYNSKPHTEDIIKDIDNRSVYVFEVSDFTDSYSDYDNDSLLKIAIFGNVDGYELNSIPYVEGDWIALSDIDSGLFQYVALDQDAYYEKDNTWKAMDINGNVSE